MNASNQQMELSLAAAQRAPQAARREWHAQNANWWFSQMRKLADQAMDWEPAPRFQSGQFSFTDAPNHE